MILVTGGTGFVGKHLVPRLAEASNVRSLARHPDRAARPPGCAVEEVAADVTDAKSITAALTADVEAVVHLIGILAEPPGRTFHDIHTQGTINVVDACLASGVTRYVHMSALGTRPGARSRYHRTKWEAEEYVRASTLDYTIIRPSVIFGPEDKFTNLFAGPIKRFPFMAVPGNGKNRFQPVYVEDVAEVFKRCIEDPATIGNTYELGGAEALTFDAVLDTIARVLGRRPPAKLHIPMSIMRVAAAALEAVMRPAPITRDQLLMLEEDNVTDSGALASILGRAPVGFAEGMATYLGPGA